MGAVESKSSAHTDEDRVYLGCWRGTSDIDDVPFEKLLSGSQCSLDAPRLSLSGAEDVKKSAVFSRRMEVWSSLWVFEVLVSPHEEGRTKSFVW